MENVEVCKENLCIVIVTYNPENYFLNTVLSYRFLAKHVIIVDNGSNKGSCVFSNVLVDEKKIDLIFSKENKGIAWALNHGIEKALDYKPLWILTFDQDSVPVVNILEYYNTVIREEGQKGEIGLIAGWFNDNIMRCEDQVRWKSSCTLITSSTLHNVEIFNVAGFYKESLFIDNVDFEYVLRVRKSGFKTLLIENEILLHKLGNPLFKIFLGLRVVSSNHNPERRFYMARNNVYITRKYLYSFPLWILKKNYFFFLSLVKILLIEKQKKAKIIQTFQGIWQGFFLE